MSNDVPQIWLTYTEFAALLNCDPGEVRKAAIAAGLDRRKSRDGQTRIKLTPPLATAFLDMVVRQFLERQMTACASDLHTMHELMQKEFPPTAKSQLRFQTMRSLSEGGPGAA